MKSLCLCLMIWSFGIAQTLPVSLKSNIGMTGRFQGPDVESGYAIKDREPAMTDFYDGNYFYTFTLEYSGQTKESSFGHYFLGVSYMSETIDTKFKNEFKDLIGDYVDVNFIMPYIGYAIYHNKYNTRNYYFFKLGYVDPDYEGRGFDGEQKFTTEYRHDASFFVSLGSNYGISKSVNWFYELMYMPMTTEPLLKKSANGDTEPVESNYEFHDTTIRGSVGLSIHF